MARIFISHSSKNNQAAIQLRDWLVQNGWDDIFLDLDPRRGIAAGERWREALQKAANRCEVVLALVSSDWVASPWCRAEIDAARMMGKKILVAILDIPRTELPPDLADEQWVDLLGDTTGYARLREGLRRAGLDPASFPFEAGRRPYPGFAPLEEKDAAIFFGREAEIVRGLDRVRRFARTGVDRMLIILGASGAGKSSYLRAGLWPRLNRDDRAWVVLPTLRPERAVISGKFGLAQAIAQVGNEPRFIDCFRSQNLPRTRNAIQEFIQTEANGLGRLLRALREAARPPQLSGQATPPPTVLIPIDQAEELYNEQGRGEARRFIEILTATLKSEDHVLALVVMRSDAFPQLQCDSSLSDCPKEAFTLEMMLAGSYRSVIEGPARLVEPKPLEIDPELTEALLKDLSGQDALPLLAFTLQHLYESYCADGRLKLADYEKLGRLKGVIATTIARAFEEGVGTAALPKERDAQLMLVREAFIPALTRVNPAGEFIRRVATRREIPSQAHPLLDRFAEHRLLIKDFRTVAGEDQEVIEIAHEALLREWSDLHEILVEERTFLADKTQLEQALTDWQGAPHDEKGGALLSGNRLDRANRWLRERPHHFTPSERQFIEESAEAKERERRKERSRRFVARLSAAGAASLAAILVGVAYSAYRFYSELSPQCAALAVYTTPNGRFLKEGPIWKEFAGQNLFATFVETHQDRGFIYISDSNRAGSNGRAFIVRIPKCGGEAGWSWSNPIVWTDFQLVSPGQ